jgi:hypothetical protein
VYKFSPCLTPTWKEIWLVIIINNTWFNTIIQNITDLESMSSELEAQLEIYFKLFALLNIADDTCSNIRDFWWVRDRPFNLKGVMVFCFVQNFFFRQHES